MSSRRRIGVLLLCVGMATIGWYSPAALLGSTATESRTATILSTHTATRFVTVRVRGRVLRRRDHVLVVQVPRFVFYTRRPRERHVVPAHVVRYRTNVPTPVALLGVSAPPVTITLPVTVFLPGPTTTDVSTETATTTISETVPTTITLTVTVPLVGDSQPGGERR